MGVSVALIRLHAAESRTKRQLEGCRCQKIPTLCSGGEYGANLRDAAVDDGGRREIGTTAPDETTASAGE
jgi:hypothetical protein